MMPVHVDEVTSDVQLDGATGVPERQGPDTVTRWDEEERFRQVREQMLRDLERVAAEGFGD
jgi:hypothetical protein